MELFLITVAGLAVLFWLIGKERRYRQKQLRDVVSDEMKKELNLPAVDNSFAKNLEDRRQRKKTSQEILRDFNNDL